MKTLMWDVGEGRVFIGPQLLNIDPEVKRAALRARGITMAINLWHRPDDLGLSNYVHAPVPDGLLNDDLFSSYDALARIASRHLAEGGTLLAQCYGGRNRSGLLAGVSLCYWLGISGNEALAMVRAGRGRSALANRHFATWLSSLPATSIRANSIASSSRGDVPS